MKSSLNKFHGEQALPVKMGDAIKLEQESSYHEEALAASFHPSKWNGDGRSRGQSRPRGGRGGQWNQGGGHGPNTNRLGFNGRPIKCKICESTMHLQRECPHREQQVLLATEVPVVLSTGSNKEHMAELTSEALNCAVLDSACSSTVAGEKWFKSFVDSIPKEKEGLLKCYPGEKVFKFGGGEIKKSNQGS